MATSPRTVTVGALPTAPDVNDRSRNVLAVLTGTAVDHRLVREAGTYVSRTGGRLVLLSLMSPREFAHRQRAYAGIASLSPYSLDQAEDTQRRIAARVGREALGPLGIDFTLAGTVGREHNAVGVAARAHDCGHLFLASRPRSVLHRLLARDVTRSIAHEFDGLVTLLHDEPAAPAVGSRASTSVR